MLYFPKEKHLDYTFRKFQITHLCLPELKCQVNIKLSFLGQCFAALKGIGRKVKTPALMSIASANDDHNHVVSVRKHRNLQEAVRRVVHMDVGRYNVIGF